MYKNNCAYAGIATYLRRHGYDVEARDSGGLPQNMNGIVEDCFRGVAGKDGRAKIFGLSPKDAADFLKGRYGDNAEGMCSIQWRSGGGHIFNWEIKNGVVSFFDGQKNLSDISRYWIPPDPVIAPEGALQYVRLDNAEINFETIKKYVKESE